MRKRILWLGLSFLLVATLVLASCAKEEIVTPTAPAAPAEEKPAAPAEEKPAAPAPGEPQYGGTYTALLMWIMTEPWLIGNWDMAGRNAVRCYHAAYMENMISGDIEKYGPRGTNEYNFKQTGVTPHKYCGNGLAESWEVYADHITFHIRPGVMWTGNENIGMEPREFTAEDAVFAMNYVTSAPGEKWLPDIYLPAEAVDKYTVNLPYKYYHYSVFDFNAVFLGMFPPEVVEAGAADWRNQVGTGPFILTNYVEGTAIEYKRNPNYWDTTNVGGKEYEIPFIDKLVYPIILDESTQIAAIRTAKLDYIQKVVAKYKETLEATCPDLIMDPITFDNPLKVFFRCDIPPFNGVNVRRAMHIATDREAIRDAVFPGGDLNDFLGANIYSLPLLERPASLQELFVYDPVKARQMLADAGYPNGFSTDLYIRAGEPNHEDVGALIQEQWAKVGVTVTLKAQEAGVLFNTYLERKYEHCIIYDQGCGPHIIGAAIRGTEIILSDPGHTLVNDELKAMLDEQYTFIASDAERERLTKKMLIAGCELAPVISMPFPVGYHCWWPWVKNYFGEYDTIHLNPAPMIARLWLDQALKKEMGY